MQHTTHFVKLLSEALCKGGEGDVDSSKISDFLDVANRFERRDRLRGDGERDGREARVVRGGCLEATLENLQ
jgi:hypothetical protein